MKDDDNCMKTYSTILEDVRVENSLSGPNKLNIIPANLMLSSSSTNSPASKGPMKILLVNTSIHQKNTMSHIHNKKDSMKISLAADTTENSKRSKSADEEREKFPSKCIA